MYYSPMSEDTQMDSGGDHCLDEPSIPKAGMRSTTALGLRENRVSHGVHHQQPTDMHS